MDRSLAVSAVSAAVRVSWKICTTSPSIPRGTFTPPKCRASACNGFVTWVGFPRSGSDISRWKAVKKGRSESSGPFPIHGLPRLVHNLYRRGRKTLSIREGNHIATRHIGRNHAVVAVDQIVG